MARTTGDPRSVYVATAAPTDATDPEDAAYTRVGYRTNVGLSSQGQSIEIRDADGADTQYGGNAVSNTLSVNYDPTQDDGVIILRNAHFALPKPTVYILETSGELGEEYVTYQAKVGAYTEAHTAGSAATQSFTLGLVSTPVFGLNA